MLIDIADMDAMERNGYTAKREIASGAFGTVVEAVHTPSRTRVAIKVVPLARMKPHERLLIDDEISILSQSSHPNILTLLDVFTSRDDTVFIVTELLRGGDLFDRIADSPLSEQEALSLAQQVLSALTYLRRIGWVHRDIKLENLVLAAPASSRAPPVVKLIDFGYATETSHTARLPGGRAGTLNYMSPQVILRRDYDAHKHDVWALGVVLYAAVSGRFPFYGTRDADTERMIVEDAPAFREREWRNTSAGFRNLVAAMLRKSEGARLETGDALVRVSGMVLDEAAAVGVELREGKAGWAQSKSRRMRKAMRATAQSTVGLVSGSVAG